METFKIEKDVPIPDKQDHTLRIKYPLAQMEIGDSFFVPNVSKKFSIYSIVRHYNIWNSTQIRVIQRRELNGVRIWRVQ